MNESYIMAEDGDNEKLWSDVKKITEMTELLHLGAYYSYTIMSDIKHLGFTMSRYKFASKLLMYKNKVDLLELGCQEALGALMFQQNVNLNRYVGVDLDKDSIKWNRMYLPKNFEFIEGDFFNCSEIRNEKFDAVVSLDVIEHIPKKLENEFCMLLVESLTEDGIAIVGTPSIMLSPYASEGSKLGHINLYNQNRLYELMNQYFQNIFIFNMNDEVVNTGFAPMSCYIFAVCCNKR